MNEESHDSKYEKEVQTEPRHGKRTKFKKSFGPEFLTYLLENKLQNYEKKNYELFIGTFMERSNKK